MITNKWMKSLDDKERLLAEIYKDVSYYTHKARVNKHLMIYKKQRLT